MTKTRTRTTFFIAIIALLAIPLNDVSATWDDTVQPGNWVKYGVNMEIMVKPPVPLLDAWNVIYLSYKGDVNLSINSVDNTTVSFILESITGNLAELIENMNLIGTNESMVPNMLLVLPLEIVANDTLSFGNVSIPFIEEVEMDHTKFWRGVPVKKMDLVESGLFGSMPMDFISFFTGGDGSAFQMDALFKWDNATGWFYQLYFKIDVSTPSPDWAYKWLSIKLEISMIDACLDIKEAIDDNRDHSLDAFFISQDVFLNPWFPLILLIICIAAFITLLWIFKARGAILLPKIQAKKKETPAPEKKKTSDKYRTGKEMGGSPKK